MKFTNFGGNVTFSPEYFYTPINEDEVLDILNRHSKNKIRVKASLHSWSNIVATNEVLIDIGKLNKVKVDQDETGTTWVKSGGGCILEDLIKQINDSDKGSMPTLGGLKKQTIAGAISTATHGSGKQSLSHFIEEYKIAAYDPQTHQAKIFIIKNGEELKAARCSLGCMGIILEVKFRLAPKYWIKESLRRYQNIEDIIKNKDKYPIQQFAFFPYSWEYFAWQRSIVTTKPPFRRLLKSALHQQLDYLMVEMLSHWIINMLLKITNASYGNKSLIRQFYKQVLPNTMKQPEVTNRSDQGLTLHTAHHAHFKHLEMEVFIAEKNIQQAVQLIKFITEAFSDENAIIPDSVVADLKKAELWDQFEKLKGSYTHHYPFFFRYVLKEDSLISMTSGINNYYAIGFFTYLEEEKRQHFYNYARFCALMLTKLLDARLHWGKYFPLAHEDIHELYPNLNKFKEICQKFDPNGVFRNSYTRRVLGF